jgi:signal peptidase I
MKLRASIEFAVIVLVAFAGCRRSVQLSGGMAPTIKAGEQVAIDYFAYTGTGPARWDVIALMPPGSASTSMVLKRVVALPSETISLTTNGIVVNGTLLALPAALTNVACFPPDKLLLMPPGGLVKFPYTVPPRHYFVIGDNWYNSLDSRYYGAVPKTNIFGKVMNK